MIELRISGDLVTIEKVAALLCLLKVEASLTSTSNVCKNAEGIFLVEPGVHLIMPECSKSHFVQAVWPALKAAFCLRCGWIDASVKSYRGCTENYVRASACPARSSLAEHQDAEKTTGGDPP